jgi:hypothetical protein
MNLILDCNIVMYKTTNQINNLKNSKMKKLSLRVLMSLSVIALSLSSIGCSNNSDDENIPEVATAKTIDEALKQQDPSSRAANTYIMKKYIFNRTNGAGGLGHVGVAFELRATINGVNYVSFYEGGVEGTNGWFGIPNAFTAPGSPNGGWWNQVSTQAQMINEFRSRGYNRYKFGVLFVSVTQATSDNSKLILARFPNRGYAVPSNNCMNASFDVIASFDNLNGNPSVPTQYFPNNWYNALTVGLQWSNSIAI